MRIREFSVLLCLIAFVYSQEVHYKQQLIFPLQKLHCHGSSIVSVDNHLLVCWFHGSGERKADDVTILGSYRKDANWGEPFMMADTPGFPDCNPVMSIDPRGQLWLFWTVVLDNHWQSALIKYKRTSQYKEYVSWEWQGNIHVKPSHQFSELLFKDLDEFV